MTSPSYVPAKLTTPNVDEIDLGNLATALRRQWQWILSGSIAGLGAAALGTAFTTPIWEGRFQIVLSPKDQSESSRLSTLIASSPMLARLADFGAGNQDKLETEVKILESPSVLKPVFDLVKAHKANVGEDISKLQFAEWLEANLKVKLEKGTSVVTISYRDNNKSTVLQVLQRISQAYQHYSGRNRRDSLGKALIYAREKIAIYRKKSEESTRAADAYRIRYGIAGGVTSVTSSSAIDISKVLSSSVGTNLGAVINPLSSNSSPLSSQNDTLAKLSSINQELIRRQQIFTSNDPSIKALMRERDALRRYVETSSAGILALPSQQALNKEQAQEIVLRYQELDRAAKRNTNALDSLEIAYQALQLEQSRTTDPWELISTPTLLEEPVTPRPARNIVLGLLSGLVLGCFAGLIADRRSGKVFRLEELQSVLQEPLLATLPFNRTEWATTLQLIANGPLEHATSLALIPVGNSHAHCEAIAKQLRLYLDHSVEITANAGWNLARTCEMQWLVAAAGSTTRRDLQSLQQQLKLHTKPMNGLVWLQG